MTCPWNKDLAINQPLYPYQPGILGQTTKAMKKIDTWKMAFSWTIFVPLRKDVFFNLLAPAPLLVYVMMFQISVTVLPQRNCCWSSFAKCYCTKRLHSNWHLFETIPPWNLYLVDLLKPFIMCDPVSTTIIRVKPDFCYWKQLQSIFLRFSSWKVLVQYWKKSILIDLCVWQKITIISVF